MKSVLVVVVTGMVVVVVVDPLQPNLFMAEARA